MVLSQNQSIDELAFGCGLVLLKIVDVSKNNWLLFGHHWVFSTLGYYFLFVLGVTQFMGTQRMPLLKQALSPYQTKEKWHLFITICRHRNVDQSI